MVGRRGRRGQARSIMSIRHFVFCVSALILSLRVWGNREIWAGSERQYQWHDSSQYSRVLVNVTQGIEALPRVWFARDRLITDFEVTTTATGLSEARRKYWATRRLLESYGLFVGTYISGTTVLPEADQTYWPRTTVSIERMPAWARYSGTWPGEPRRKVIDLADVKTRHRFLEEIQRVWKEVPAPVRFVDNAAAHRSTGASSDWSTYCTNIKEIRKMGDAAGSVTIFNIAVHVGLMSDDEARRLVDAVGHDGICLEMPWHSNIRRSAEETEKARIRYRQLLDSGMGIIMIPGDGDAAELIEWVRSWRKPSDHIYISGVFYKPPDQRLFGPSQ
jgi:hypothetical protein